ncbi:PH domain-containing [Hyphodiscus hymeniophilus]|uniref:PH domain-containing n=1 Tax=Hyphodiscus hymeniophilus TaxID=353542 RepID=A0A9P6VFE7_9HELO|nr:PH domain-containing [Hyphodiscus hymeniophilus]
MVDFASSEQHSSHVAVNRLSISIPTSNRVSMEDDCDGSRSPESPVTTIDENIGSPPSYDADDILQSPLIRQKFNIQPREDEGREILPSYSSEISLETVFSKKVELEGAIHRATDRNCYKSSSLAIWASESKRSEVPVPAKKGPFLKSYNLQHADVGIAADYFKKRYVIRVRAETDQFLLSCCKIETFVQWLQSLFAAIDIAPPLDTRPLPRDLSIPQIRRRRTSCSTPVRNLEQNAALVREQYELMRRLYPGLVEDPLPEVADPPSPTIPTIEVQPPTTSRLNTAPASFATVTPNFSEAARTNTVRTRSTTALSSSSTISERHPSVSSETGKWRPEHQWSAMYDMLYAKRCMAILTSGSPRKSDIVIMEGKQWNVDWTTGALTRCEPPDYGEIVAEKRGGHDPA